MRKNSAPIISKCQYANDTEDEYCATCNGVTMVIDGKEFPCTECEGYAPSPSAPVTTAKVDSTTAEPKTQPVTGPLTSAVPTPAQTAETPVEDAPANKYIPQGVVTVIKAESGLSAEFTDGSGKSRWYRFGYTEERHIPETADLEKEREALWEAVNAEVDTQIAEISEFMKTVKK